MGDVHKGLEDATQDVSRLILKPESMKLFRKGKMLDDHCLDSSNMKCTTSGSRSLATERAGSESAAAAARASAASFRFFPLCARTFYREPFDKEN